MPIEVNSTPLDPEANSFVSIPELDTYLGGHAFGSELVVNKNPDEKARAVITATSELSNVDYNGVAVSEDQQIAFPRRGLVSRLGFVVDDTIFPNEIKKATCEYARLKLIAEDDPVNSIISSVASQGLSKVEVEGIRLGFRDVDLDGSIEEIFFLSLPPSVRAYIPSSWIKVEQPEEEIVFFTL